MWNPLHRVIGALGADRDTEGSVPLALRLGSSVDTGLRLTADVGGGEPFGVLLDTGSTGLVIGSKHLGRDYTPTGESFTDFTYSSSGNSYSGEWVIAPVRFATTSGGHVSTVPMRVRMVTQQHRRNEGLITDPRHITVAMLGVGFDRVDPHGSTVDPTLNPFLMIDRMRDGGGMRAGYVISGSSVELGITDENTAGFDFVQLERLPAGQGDDWRAPRSCISVPTAGVGPQCGRLLVDTGLRYAIVQVPAGIDPPQRQGIGSTARRQVLEPGQRVVVTLPDLDDRTLCDFTVGDADTGAPDEVAWGHRVSAHGGEAFMNVSLHALSRFDYAYDAVGGRMGFRFHAVV